jgi:hypothetical protein
MGYYSNSQIAFVSNALKSEDLRMQGREYDSKMYDPGMYDTITGRISSVDSSTLSFTIDGYGGAFRPAGVSNRDIDLVSQMNLNIQQLADRKKDNAYKFSKAVREGDTATVRVRRDLASSVDSEGYVKAGVNIGGSSLNAALINSRDFAIEKDDLALYGKASAPERGIGYAWNMLSHNVAKYSAPLEYVSMFGFSPGMKFLNYRTAREDYEQTEIYGEGIRMWQKPFSHWFAPAIKTALHNWAGMDYIPAGVRKEREIEEHFDKTKYHKYRLLEEQAVAEGNTEMAAHYSKIRRTQTIHGAHGYQEAHEAAKVLKGKEAQYAMGFFNETDIREKSKILDMVPIHKKKIIEDQYRYQEFKALNRMQGVSMMSDYSMDLYGQRRSEAEGFGYPVSEGTNPVDAYYEKKDAEASTYFKNRGTPNPDWLGFNPAVDLEDVKLKYLEKEGFDYHDHSIYQSRKKFLHRKPYINDNVIREMNMSVGSMDQGMQAMQQAMRIMNHSFTLINFNPQGIQRSNDLVNINITNTHNVNPFEE